MRFIPTSKKWRFLLVIVLLTPALIWLANRLWPLPLSEVQMARVVVSEDGTPLWRFADQDGVWRYPVELKDVSPYYLEALLTYEDRWFYQHKGINPLSMARALLQNISNGRIVSGGSTLSMQVARLIEPHDRTVGGKIRQMWRTLQLEWYLSKDEILTIYLNRAPYGGTLQGIGAASWAYLGKPPSELTRSEAALMAVLPQAPSRLRPDRYPERAQAARDKVLQRLAEYQVWSDEQVAEIQQESVYIAPRQTPQLAPLLARRLAANSNNNVIVTTLDISLQRRLEDMALSWKTQLPERNSLAVLVVDHATMSVRAYIGSADFNDESRFGHVDMISSWRSPGSTLKPFIYGLALDDGLIHAESLMQDVPRRFGDYRPGNFDTGFNGAVSAADSLMRSLNLPAVQLLEAYGPKRFAAVLRNAGLVMSFPMHSEPNLSLILGGTGTRMDQLVSAYSAFARSGKAAQLRFTPDEPLLERQLMSPGAAWIVRRILAGESRPVPNNLVSDIVPLAWKTGTSYGYRDAWAIGVNPRYIIGVWVGRPDSTPVAGQFGFATAIPFLYQVNNLLEQHDRSMRIAPQTDPRPDSVDQQTICWPQGQPLAEGDANCRQRRNTWVLEGTTPPTLAAPGQDSLMGGWMSYWQNAQGMRVAPDCPGAIEQRLALWPTALLSWLPPMERLENRLPKIDPNCPPIGNEVAPPLLIMGIKNDSLMKRLPGKSTLELRAASQGGAGQRWWFLNGEQITEEQDGGQLIYSLSRPGKYQLVVMDESGQIDKVSFRME